MNESFIKPPRADVSIIANMVNIRVEVRDERLNRPQLADPSIDRSILSIAYSAFLLW